MGLLVITRSNNKHLQYIWHVLLRQSMILLSLQTAYALLTSPTEYEKLRTVMIHLQYRKAKISLYQ